MALLKRDLERQEVLGTRVYPILCTNAFLPVSLVHFSPNHAPASLYFITINLSNNLMESTYLPF